MAIIKISDENWWTYIEETIINNNNICTGDDLRVELEQIEAQLLILANEPNEILIPNDSKFLIENNLNIRKQEIINILQ
jgi:hypothetical protein